MSKILLIVLIMLLAFMIFAYKYRNPYKLVMVFGKKGSGKTTLMTKLTLKYLKKGIPVYSNVAIPGAYLFDPLKLGFEMIPPDSVLMIDEVGLIWNSRDFKSFKKEYREYFKYQRQYRHTVWLFSQSFDIDKSMRDLCDCIYLTRCWFNVFSVCRRVNKIITLVHPSGDGEARITDDYAYDNLLFFWAGAIKVTFIPRYTAYFKSYNPPLLPDPDDDYVLCPMPELPYHNKKEYIIYVTTCIYHNLVRWCKDMLRRISSYKTYRIRVKKSRRKKRHK